MVVAEIIFLLPTVQHTPIIKDTTSAKVVVIPMKVLVLVALHHCHCLHRMGMDTHHPSISILDLLLLLVIIILLQRMTPTTSIAWVVLLVVASFLLQEKVTILVLLHLLLMVHLLPASISLVDTATTITLH